MVPGEELHGRFRIVEQLGAGGTAEVYLVENLAHGRREAIKVLQADLADTPELVTRFRREARAINRLDHPNVIAVYDFGELPDGRFYLAMEHVDGTSLGAVIAAGPLPPPRAMCVLSQLADAVDHAHTHGVIHRDLKPDNVMLCRRRGRVDQVKVLDFGLAKIVDVPDALGTVRGAAVGTPPYMAPEQFTGAGYDARVDIYALGCLAFAILTGRPPFVGGAMEVMDAHVGTPPPRPGDVAPAARIPRALEDLVLRCLAKDPKDRPQTGRAVRDALRAVPGFVDNKDSGTMRATVDVGALGRDTATMAGDLLAAGPDESASVKAAYRDNLRDAATLLLDAGAGDAGLVVALAELDAALADVASRQHELTALGEQASQVEQETRRREASARFALGELRFERDRTQDPSIDARMETLEHGLRAALRAHDDRLAAITEAEIAAAVAVAEHEDATARAARALHAAIGAVLSAHPTASDDARARLAQAEWLSRMLA